MSFSAAQPLSRVTVRPVDPLEGTALYCWTLRLCVFGLLIIAVRLGSPLVCLAGLSAGVLLPLLDRAGGVWCAMICVALASAAAVCSSLTVPFALWASETHNWPLLPTVAGGVGLVVLPAVCIGGILGSWISRPLRQLRYAYVVNRTCGAAAALIIGTLVTALLSWSCDIFGPAISKYSDAASAKYPNLTHAIRQLNLVRWRIAHDPAGYWLNEHNPLWHVTPLVTLAARAEFSADNHRLWKEFYAGELRDLLEIPVVNKYFLAVKADPELRQAIDRHDLSAILNSRHFVAAISDDELTEVAAQNWPRIRAHISERQITVARAAATKLDTRSRARFDQLLRRARELGIDDPWAPVQPR